MVEENWLRVAGYAMMLGVGLYLVPLGMIVNPSLIELAEAPLQASWALVKIGAGLGAISFGIISPSHVWVRIGLVIIGAVLIFVPCPDRTEFDMLLINIGVLERGYANCHGFLQNSA